MKNEERAWHFSSRWCKSSAQCLCEPGCVGLVMNNMNTIPGLTWIPLTALTMPSRLQRTLSLSWWPGRIIYETNSASHIILRDKDGVDIIFHSHFSHIHSRCFYNADSQKWVARKHKTYNGIPFQLAGSATVFSFQATSFPILNRLYRCHQEANETKTNKNRMLLNFTSAYNLCLRLDILKWLSEIVSCHGSHLDRSVTVISEHF